MAAVPLDSPPAPVRWDDELVRLYKRHYDGLVRLAYLVSGEAALAEEVVQEAFVKAHRSWDHVRNPLPYLRTAVVNGCRSWGRRQKLERERRPRPPEPVRQEPDELWDALATLKERPRAAIVLRYYADLPDAEIAVAVAERAFPTPGSEGWDPATAPPVWPVVGEAGLGVLAAGRGNGPALELGDPATVLSAYLDAVASPVVIAATTPTVAANGWTATADWQFAEPGPEASDPAYAGTIFLRRFDATDGPGWVVVGAATRPTSAAAAVLSEVRSDGVRLRFTVTSDSATGDAIAVRARVNDVPVSVGGESLPQGASPDPLAGELVRFDDSNRRELELSVEPGDRVEVLVRHIGGTWLSLTHMAVDVPLARKEPPTPSSLTTLAPSTSTDAEASPAQTTATTAATGTVEHVDGTYQGTAHFSLTTGGCPTLDHVLDSTFSLSDGSTWQFHSDYCGTLVGDLWTGTGSFTFTTSTGDTITGTLESSARVPSDGEPFELRITGGTGAYEGASGSCRLDNHLLRFEFGIQGQFGTFTCDLWR